MPSRPATGSSVRVRKGIGTAPGIRPLNDEQVAGYLGRIGHHGSTRATAATLRAIHAKHYRVVPFENLDLHLGRPIVLEPGALYRKIVEARRGGFCYELNGLFASLLLALGFDVSLLSCRVMLQDGRLSPEFDHLALLVRLRARWLADVGFGDALPAPIHLDVEDRQAAGREAFRIRGSGSRRMLQRRDRRWIDLYQVGLKPRAIREFEPRCRWHETSPRSGFQRARIVTIPTRRGRVTVRGDRLIETVGGRRRERVLSGEEVAGLLGDRFGFRDTGLLDGVMSGRSSVAR